MAETVQNLPSFLDANHRNREENASASIFVMHEQTGLLYN